MPHLQAKKLFLCNEDTMKRHCIDGFVKSTHESTHKSLRKHFENYTIYSTDELPPKIDLRPWMTPIEDQSKTNACTANALAGLYEYLIKKSTDKHIDVSRLFIYYNARKKDKENDNAPPILTDEGASIISTIEILKETGTCLERSWPYVKTIVNIKPSKESKKEAKNFRIRGAMQIPVDLYHMKSCLAQGFPIIFGLQIYASFDKAATNGGVVPMPESSMATRATHGTHAMLIAGYSDASEAFIVRNSWGEDWGDNGYCYIPYEYMTNKELCSDLWTVNNTSAKTLGTAHWDMQDTIDHRAHNKALGPGAYADNNDGLSIKPVITQERVCSSRLCPNFPTDSYGPPPAANYNGPPAANYNGPPAADYNAPPAANYPAPPAANYPAPPAFNYPAPPAFNYSAPPVFNYPAPSFVNYMPSPMMNYPMPPSADYAMAPAANYPILPIAPYIVPRSLPLPVFPNIPIDPYPRRIIRPPRRVPPRIVPAPLFCVETKKKPPGLLRKIFLKP